MQNLNVVSGPSPPKIPIVLELANPPSASGLVKQIAVIHIYQVNYNQPRFYYFALSVNWQFLINSLKISKASAALFSSTTIFVSRVVEIISILIPLRRFSTYS